MSRLKAASQQSRSYPAGARRGDDGQGGDITHAYAVAHLKDGGMKERPILFSGPMVRAILEGRKTQTRRVVKPQPVGGDTIHKRGMDDGWIVGQLRDSENAWRDLRCPYGQPGDLLWVRETWFEELHPLTVKPYDQPRAVYRATEEREVQVTDGDGWAVVNKDGTLASPWRPSIHMPRWASRITLRVTGVRVERLQEISGDDAKTEGADYYVGGHGMVSESDLRCEPGYWYGPLGYVNGFSALWNSINAKRGHGWDTNPWVWVIEFERAEKSA